MTTFWLLIVVVGCICVVALLLSWHLGLWLQAYVSGADIGLVDVLMMSLRRVNPQVIVRCKVMAIQAGLAQVATREIEALVLAGGDAQRVTLALIAADRANIALDWHTAVAIELAGRDILQAVRSSVNPRTICCPDVTKGNNDTLVGVAKDGIQLKVRVLVTVRTNLLQLIGGADEPTIVARVGQGIVAAIGACNNYGEALADPALISREVAARGLDAQTSFTIVSIDIADIDVGSNIGARLRLDQAAADIRIALAASEARRSMAVAYQQEMIALKRKHQANLLLAEAHIPTAIAAALRQPQFRSIHNTISRSEPPLLMV